MISKLGQHRLDISTRAPHAEPVRAMTRYEQRVVRARRLGYLYPYEVIRMLEGSSQEAELSELPVLGGTFQEYDVSGADEGVRRGRPPLR